MFPRYARDEYFRSERKTGKQNGISLDRALSRLSFARTEEEEGRKREIRGGTKDIRAVELSSFIVRLRLIRGFNIPLFFLFYFYSSDNSTRKQKKKKKNGGGRRILEETVIKKLMRRPNSLPFLLLFILFSGQKESRTCV